MFFHNEVKLQSSYQWQLHLIGNLAAFKVSKDFKETKIVVRLKIDRVSEIDV